jgi:biopolymer transport protein ExbD
MQLLKLKFVPAIRLREPDTRVESFCILNILILFCCFSLLNSRFVLPPGTAIALPSVGNVDSRETIGVVTVQSEKFIMFNGNIFSLETLERGLGEYLKKNHGSNVGHDAILVRPDKSLPVDTLLKICEIAKRSGYATVQIATQTSNSDGVSR